MEKERGTIKEEICYHCGEDLPKITYQSEDKSFCCAGCLGVFKILSENNLCNYYAYNSA
ncbi:MAG: heavy metal translocating P-type ATPase metal-binding domain-containing protein, partial [Pedobacter sp.]|nr:heavy metal translocating P-type ATPase metal-binding domain-containing protein [Pedobacter sp.]